MKAITDGTLKNLQHMAIQIGSHWVVGTKHQPVARDIEEACRKNGLFMEKQEVVCLNWVEEQILLDSNFFHVLDDKELSWRRSQKSS